MTVERIKVYKIEVNDSSLILHTAKSDIVLPLRSLSRVGTIKRFSRILVVLVIIMAALSIVTQELLHTVLVLLMLGVCLATREEVLIVETVEGRIFEIASRNREQIKKIARQLLEYLTQRLSQH